MSLKQKNIEIITSYEGLSLKAYLCPAKIPTIGYGTTKGVKLGDVITREKAIELLHQDLARFEDYVNKNYPTQKQNEFDALVSFVYNLGSIERGSNLDKGLKANNKIKIFEFWNKYTRAGGKSLLGLRRRRLAESILYLDYPEVSWKACRTMSDNDIVQTKIKIFEWLGVDFDNK